MSDGVNDYFATEAREHLDQLDRLLSVPGVPDPDHLMRLATNLRGAAQMAHAETVANVAERLEDTARSLLSHNVSWSEELRVLARQTVGDLELMVRALNRWGDEQERRVRTALERWDEHDGGQAAGGQSVPADAEKSSQGETNLAEHGRSDLEPDSASMTIDDQVPDDSGTGKTSDGSGGVVTPEPARPARTGEDFMAAEMPKLTRIIPISALFYDDGDPNIIEAPAATNVVPIESLLLRGDAALEEALALRPIFENIARGDPVTEVPVAMLVDELFDLVELGKTADHAEA